MTSVDMAKPASAGPPLQRRAAQSVDITFRCSDEYTENSPCIQTVIGSPPKFNQLFIGPLPTFPENFSQIRADVFAQSC